jgi:transposase
VASLTEIEQATLANAAPGTRLEVVVEPTGPAWLPVAVFFTARGHTVYRVASAKAADLRRFLSRRAKSNGIDADTLARLPLVDPGGLHPLVLPGAERAALERRVRACDRLTQQAAAHKRRIKDLVRQLLPVSPLTGDLGQADLAVLERWADPHLLLTVGRARLVGVIARASTNHLGIERAQQWQAAAHAAVQLYGEHPAIAFTDLAAEVASEVRLPRAVQAELDRHAAERERSYHWTDPLALARSLPGLAQVGGPALVATMGPAARFATASQFRSFTGLAPRASQTGDTDRKGQPMSKAGNRLLRTTLIRAADHARKQDPQLARIYHLQMVGRGKDHLGALCVVAAPPGRTGLDRHASRHAVRDLRHRRHPGHPRTGQGQHRHTVDRGRGAPPPAAEQKGEGPSPSPHGTCEWRSRRTHEATFPHQPVLDEPTPASTTPTHPHDSRSSIGNQETRSYSSRKNATRPGSSSTP